MILDAVNYLDQLHRGDQSALGLRTGYDDLDRKILRALQVDASRNRQPGVTTVRISNLVAADANGAAIERQRLGATTADGALRIE